jgi:hypothetical protein
MVQRKDAPVSIEELAQSKWAGKMAVDDESYDWLAAMLDYYGEAKGMELAAKIGQQSLQVRRGPTLITQLVAAGEFHIEIDGHHQEATAKKKSGAPIDYIFPQPYVPVKSLVPIYMAARPPHPHAAALLADFLMSKKGQDIMYGHGRWVGHKSILGKGPDDIGDRKVVIPAAEKWGDRYQELIGLFNKVLLRKTAANVFATALSASQMFNGWQPHVASMHEEESSLSRRLVVHRQSGLRHLLDDAFALQLGMGVHRCERKPDSVANARGGHDAAAVTKRPMLHKDPLAGIVSRMDLYNFIGVDDQRLSVGSYGFQRWRMSDSRQSRINDNGPRCPSQTCVGIWCFHIVGIKRQWTARVDPKIGKKVRSFIRRDFCPALDPAQLRTKAARIDLHFAPRPADPVIALSLLVWTGHGEKPPVIGPTRMVYLEAICRGILEDEVAMLAVKNPANITLVR